MFENIHIKTELTERAALIGQYGAVLAMGTATGLGMVELPHSFAHATVVQMANVVVEEVGHEPSQRKEKEEHGPHYSMKTVSQRTPGRTGKV